MRKIVALLIGSLLIGAAPAAAGPRIDPALKLERELAGRVAGEPVRCLNMSNIRSSRIIDRTAIIYDAGSTIYVNRPRAGRESLDQWDVLVTTLHGPQLCSIDVVRLYDSGSRFQSGVVFLGEFVPYRRVK